MPLDLANTVAPDPAATPTPAPAPAQSTPAPNVNAVPSATAPATPASPAGQSDSTAAPSATASAQSLPKHGLMYSALVGALEGIKSHVAKTSAAADAGKVVRTVGKGIAQRASDFAQNSPRGQELKANALDRQAKQQQMNQSAAAAMDDATLKKVQIQHYNMQNFADMHNMQKADEAENTPFVDFLQQYYPDQIQEFKSDELNAEAARYFGPNGQQNVALSNGKPGNDAGLIGVGQQFMETTPLKEDFAIPSVNWRIDPSTGEAVPTDKQPSTLVAGNHTLWDAYQLVQTSNMNKARVEADFDASQKRAENWGFRTIVITDSGRS